MTSVRHRKLRVLLVGPSLSILGGQAVQAQRLLKGLEASDRVSVDFMPVNPELPGLLGALQRIKYVRTVVTSTAYLIELLRRVPNFDVVHAFSASYFSYVLAPLPAMIVARAFSKASVLNYRSGEASDHLSKWRLTAVPTMRRFATAIIVPSQYLVEVFRTFGLPARAIHNFVPIERIPYRRREQLSPRFLSNRNLEALYNVACTVRAFQVLHERWPKATLTIAGDGAERSRLEKLVSSLGISGAVQFVGRVSNEVMDSLYADADVYLNSPNIDNMPASIIEAFAAGVPVVSSDAGGIPFIVRDGENGLLVRVNDHEALAKAAMRLFDEGSLALSLADAARRDCETLFTWSAVQAQWETAYLAIHSRTTLREGHG